ncbi:MAG: CsbD family protein, partial [Acidiferrobacteraceae bacterium]
PRPSARSPGLLAFAFSRSVRNEPLETSLINKFHQDCNTTLEEKGKVHKTAGKVQADYGDLKEDLKKGR